MSCEEFVGLVTAFLDGVMDEDTERRFIVHLSRCAGCEAYLAQIIAVRDALCQLPAPHIARDELLNAFRDWSA